MKYSKTFVGRKQELARLGRFFESEQGGAILIAGDRGSGKTTLVEESITRLEESDSWYERHIRYFRRKRIVVRIPLIIPDDNETPPAAYYRSMLMRAIARGLEQDLLSRRWSGFDLPNRWFRSIGYLQEIHRVMPFAKYISLKKSTTKALKLAAKGISGSIDDLTASELEVNDTVLEIALRHLLSNHKSNHDFIFVIDELDKLNHQQENIHVEDIAMLLKNLFNETGVHVAFIADEPSLGRITERIRNNPFCAERTLFKDTILLNQMHPDEFANLVDCYIGHTDAATRRRHVASLSLLTRMMPSEMERLQLQTGIDINSLVDTQRSIMGSYEYSYASTMQVVVNHVYAQYCGRHGQYYDRVLFKALNEAGTNLLNNEVSYFAWDKWIGLLYTSDYFDDDTTERNAKNSDNYESLKEVPDIIGLIEQLNRDDQDSTKKALGTLLVLLDRLDYLSLKLVDKFLIQVRFVGDAFTVDNLPEDIDSCYEPRKDELEIIARLNRIGHIYLKVVGTAIWTDIWPFPMEVPNDHNGGGVTSITDRHLMDRTLTCFWAKVEEALDKADAHITASLGQTVTTKMGSIVGLTFAENTDCSIEVSSSQTGYDQEVKVIVYHGQKIMNDFSGFGKVFILQDADDKYESKPEKLVKKYTMTNRWANYDKVISELATTGAKIIKGE